MGLIHPVAILVLNANWLGKAELRIDDTHSCFLIREDTSLADFLLELLGVGAAGTIGESSFSASAL